jgi:signal transduction histidine kinase
MEYRETMGSSVESDSAGAADSPSDTRLLRLAEEQAALRQIATLVASGAPSAEVFSAVAQEVAEVMHLPMVGVYRYDSDGLMTVIATCSDRPHVLHPGTRWPLDGPSMIAQVYKTGRPARIEDYTDLPGALAEGARQSRLNATAGAPIIVDGSVWGAMGASSPDEPLPDGIEDRLAEFTELLAVAIANTESREQLARLADEQSALRRVATLVAERARPTDVFEAVLGEVGRLLPTDAAAFSRCEADGTVTTIGSWSRGGGYIPMGMRHPLSAGTLVEQIVETGRPARIDSYLDSSGWVADAVRELGWRSSVGTPLIVEGRLWGVLAVASMTDRRLPASTERRLTEFGALVATAIANAESRAELNASRARIVATADATRRRIERDLHDGTQQRLVSLALELRAAEQAVPAELHEHRAALGHAADGLTGVLNELREIARGIHPAILAEGGLGPALKTLARRSAVPVELELPSELQLPEGIEVATYYIVSEALTNAAKYAHASVVRVAVEVHEQLLRVSVRDDGRGGADPDGGSGLVGLKDRAEAMGGTISLRSPLGAGTSVEADLPLTADAGVPIPSK